MNSVGLKTALAAGALVSCSLLSGQANATPFTINAATLTPGSGYGIDGRESSGTLLDVRFSTAGFATQNFNLNSVGDFSTFLVGTVDLEEPNAMGGVNPNETNDLGLTVHFTFANPVAGLIDVVATGTATTGAVSDAAVDYTLGWTPLLLNFSSTGQFNIALDPLSFSGAGAQDLMARVTLLAEDQSLLVGATDIGVEAVPEPTTLVLFGAGLAGLGAMRRRKHRA